MGGLPEGSQRKRRRPAHAPIAFNKNRGTLTLGNTNLVFVRVAAHCSRERYYLYLPTINNPTLSFGEDNISIFLTNILENIVENKK